MSALGIPLPTALFPKRRLSGSYDFRVRIIDFLSSADVVRVGFARETEQSPSIVVYRFLLARDVYISARKEHAAVSRDAPLRAFLGLCFQPCAFPSFINNGL